MKVDTDARTELPELWQQFEDLVRRILEANGFAVTHHSPRGDNRFDFIGSLNNEFWAIEVKYYRTNRAQPHLIEAAAARVANRRRSAPKYSGMLVVSCSLPPSMRLALQEKFNITLVDRLDLDTLTSKQPLLSEELQVLLGSNLSPVLEEARQPNDLFKQTMLFTEKSPPAEDTRGTELCNQLRTVKPGKKDWATYEIVCAHVLRYLFPNDLQGWYKQKRTDDGLHRFDFVCRLHSTTEFWHFLIDHLNSRYIIFEFKNYTNMIEQGQILTTEKYLLERALRRVAIIFSRKGANKDAVRMTQGAMREHGKLMLVVNDAMVCKMLHMKESGEDPTDFLFELADNFLLSLPR